MAPSIVVQRLSRATGMMVFRRLATSDGAAPPRSSKIETYKRTR